jgi:hypothetical protein
MQTLSKSQKSKVLLRKTLDFWLLKFASLTRTDAKLNGSLLVKEKV